MPEPDSKEVFRQIAVGLRGLKKRKILHRDIKLGNILISSESNEIDVCIADFGIATQLRDHNDTRSF